MIRKIAKIIGLIAVTFFVTSGQALAGTITYNFTTVLQLDSGTDEGGLDGATLQIYAEFDDSAVYVSLFGAASINAQSHAITISGASVGSSNGVYSDPDGVVYVPTFFNSFQSMSGNYLAAGPLSRIVNETDPGSVIPSLGNTISVDHFNTTGFDPRLNYTIGEDGSRYIWATNASLTVSTIPLPSAAWLMLWGLASLLGIRHHR